MGLFLATAVLVAMQKNRLSMTIVSLVVGGVIYTFVPLPEGYKERINSIFVEEEEDLVAVFNNEFNDLMSVVAGDFEIHARVAKGVRPVRVLGTDADI